MYGIAVGIGILCLSSLGWLATRRQRSRVKLYRPEWVGDLPDSPSPFVLYIAGAGENAWAASMVCPCGCQDVIELNLLQQVRPRWSAVEHADGTVSLNPSVWRNIGCRSHFILNNGEIHWCPSQST